MSEERGRPLTKVELDEIRAMTTEAWIEKNGPAEWSTATVKRLIATVDALAEWPLSRPARPLCGCGHRLSLHRVARDGDGPAYVRCEADCDCQKFDDMPFANTEQPAAAAPPSGGQEET